MADTFLMCNTDGSTESATVIDRFTMPVHGVPIELVTHASNSHDLNGLKKITHYRTGLCITLLPIKADIAQCRVEVEHTLKEHNRLKVIQRLTEPPTLNPATSEAPTHPPKEDDMSLEDALNKNSAAVAELTAALLQHIANNPGKGAMPAADAAKEEPKNEKPTKATKAPKEEKAPAPEIKAEEPATLDLEKDIKPLAVKVASEKGRDMLVALLNRMGCKVGKTSELKTEQYAEFVDLANETIAGKYDPLAGGASEDDI